MTRRWRPCVNGDSAPLPWTENQSRPGRWWRSTSGCCDQFALRPRGALPAAQLLLHGIEIEIDHWRNVEREELAHHQASDHRQSERLACIGAFTVAQRDRQRAEQRGDGGHHDRTEAQQAALPYRLARGFAAMPGINGE